MSGLVSTILPVRNRPRLLGEAVESVLRQTYRPLEIIIVDDGSTDETPRIAEALARQHPREIRVLRQSPAGPGPAREAGRQRARGAFVQYLDSDDLLLPAKFEIQIAALDAAPAADIAYGPTQHIDADGAMVTREFKWTGRDLPHLFPGLLVDRWWCTHTPLYRRRLTDRIGPWPTLRFSQDWLYDARAGALGARLVHGTDPVSQHRTHRGPRQTGSGRWLEPGDQETFFRELHAAARQAGVGSDTPEMRHFVRWVFSAARIAGAQGAASSADTLLDLAIRAADTPPRQLLWFRRGVRLLGWARATALAEGLARRAGRRTGPETLPQSWMDDVRHRPDTGF